MTFVKLEKLCSIITDGTHQTPTYSNEGYIFLSSKNVTSKKIDWDNVKYIPEELHIELSKRLKPQKNDVLLAKNGTTGVAALVDRDEVFDIYVSLALLRPNEMIYPPYLLHAINSPMAKHQFNKSLKGIGVPNLHLKEIKNVSIPVPDIDIQNKIVDVLDKAQELIDKRKAQIEALDELVKSRFIEMFGDPVKNPKQLPRVELGKLGDWKTGGTPSRTNNEFYNGNIPWLSSGELNSIYCYGSNEMITEVAIKESAAKIIEKGSLLLGMYDTAALKSTINMIECSCNQAIAYAKLDEKLVNTIFAYYCIQIGKDFYKSQQRGVRQKNLNLSMVKGLEILMPDLDLQNQFENFIKQADKMKFEMEKSLRELENNFSSLIQRAFKGELFN